MFGRHDIAWQPHKSADMQDEQGLGAEKCYAFKGTWIKYMYINVYIVQWWYGFVHSCYCIYYALIAAYLHFDVGNL